MGSHFLYHYTCDFVVFFILFLLSFDLYKSSLVSADDGNITDMFSLRSFKNSLISDPLQVTKYWNESTHFCSWRGITCDISRERVVKLDLNSSMLVGSLPPSIGNMSFLKEFVIYNNSFSGEIPPEIGRLSRLQILSFENNSFTGEIPRNVSRCSNLIRLGLGGNHLMGSIPTELQLLSNLQLFFLYVNNLTGELPLYLGNMTSLEYITVGGNNFVGRIPDTLGNLKNLEVIEFGLNNLSGPFPPSFFNISSLTHVDIPFNQLEGSLPPDIFISLPKLRKLNIGHNRLTGSVPSSVSNASELMLLALNANGFSGEVPSFSGARKLDWLALNKNRLGYGRQGDLNFMFPLLNCTELRLLHLSENNFSGMLPSFIGNFSNLRRFSIGRNLIHGNVPAEIGEIENLETLFLWSNQLSGSIPNAVGKLHQLKILSIWQNMLSGEIPSSFGNLTRMTETYLQKNNFRGAIPSVFENWQALLAMDVSQNNFSGQLPRGIFNISSLSELLDISSNSLTGSLPSDVSGLDHLVLLNLSNNRLSGVIPDSFGRLTSLRDVYLANNFFQGNISRFLSSLKGLEILDLSHNNFTGEIPVYLKTFSFLRSLNLSFNNFEGELPADGVFLDGSTQVLVTGNSRLCGGIPSLYLPKCPEYKPSEKSSLSRSVRLKITISIPVVAIILLVLFAAIYFMWYKKRLIISSESNCKEFLPTISFHRLFKATDGFSEANLIGSGKFGNVYKGVLDQDETMIAIKVFKLQVRGASKSFVAECESLRSIRHRNLVKFLTSCSSVDYQGNEFKALIYPLMMNGSLEDWLHWNQETDKIYNEQRRNLTLIQRLSIAIDVACALDYLHNHSGTPLVHCDVKPSNVLLDEDFVAHLGDFGLARFIQESNLPLASGKYDSSMGIKGTVGYAAPEYGMGEEPSIYGDVYSYGILLLELFTGKRPTDDIFTNGMSLHYFVKAALPEHVMEVLDPELFYDDHLVEMAKLSESIEHLVSVFQMGISCSVESPRDRTEISRVLNELYSIRNEIMKNVIQAKAGSKYT